MRIFSDSLGQQNQREYLNEQSKERYIRLGRYIERRWTRIYLRDVNFQSQTQPHSLHSSRNQICDEFWVLIFGRSRTRMNRMSLRLWNFIANLFMTGKETARQDEVRKSRSIASRSRQSLKIFVRNFAGIFDCFHVENSRVVARLPPPGTSNELTSLSNRIFPPRGELS